MTANPDENPGDIYITTKDGQGACSIGGVGKIGVDEHKNLAPGQTLMNYAMPRVVDFPPVQGEIDCSEGPFRPWTGSDMRRDGRLIAMIRQGPPASVYFFPRTEQQTVAEALSTTSCGYIASTSFGLDNEKKHEGVAFVDPAGLRFSDISECEDENCSPSLYQYELEYPDSDFSVIQEPVTGTWGNITYDTFEGNDWGSYSSGGVHAVVSDNNNANACGGSCACEGTWAVKLNEDMGNESSIFHSTDAVCSGYDILRVSFSFKFRDYDHLDTLFVEISLDGGLTYFIVGDYAFEVAEEGSTSSLFSHPGEKLVRKECYQAKILLVPSQFRVTSFGDAVRLRFRNSGNAANDIVYVDQIKFEGYPEAPDATFERIRRI